MKFACIIRVSVLFIVAVCLPSSSSLSFAETEWVKNGDFEDGGQHWSIVYSHTPFVSQVAFWSGGGNPDGRCVITKAADAYTAGEWIGIQQGLNCSGAWPSHLEFSYSPGGDSNCNWHIEARINGQSVGTIPGFIDELTWYTASFPIPPGSGPISVEIIVVLNWVDPCTAVGVYLDNVDLVYCDREEDINAVDLWVGVNPILS